MTSGTRERKQRRCWECGNVAWHNEQIAPEVCCKKCGSQDTRLVKEPTPTPPPLQPGDEVWVRAKINGFYGDMVWVSLDGDCSILSVPTSAIRRIEGEVKP